MLLVPARTRRSWSVPGGYRCSVAWIEFAPDVSESLWPAYLLRHNCDISREVQSYRSAQQHFMQRGATRALCAEAELKSMLARFLLHAESTSKTRAAATAGGASIQHATEWLGAHFHEPDAMRRLPAHVRLSPNHFRLLFRRATWMSPQRYLLTLRMRAARSHLQESQLSVKEIARAVGYSDALYFSRLYKRFWKTSPTTHR